ncbi:hypothetical protein AAMO2058_000288300 [Amorphochlora amoebiformis]
MKAVVNSPHHMQAMVTFQKDMIADRDIQITELKKKIKILKSATKQLIANGSQRKTKRPPLPPLHDTQKTSSEKVSEMILMQKERRIEELSNKLKEMHNMITQKEESQHLLVKKNIQLQQDLYREKQFIKRFERTKAKLAKKPTVKASLWSSALDVVIPKQTNAEEDPEVLGVIAKLREKNDKLREQLRKREEIISEMGRRYEKIKDRNRDDHRNLMELQATMRELEENAAQAKIDANEELKLHNSRSAAVTNALKQDIQRLKARHAEDTRELISDHSEQLRTLHQRLKKKDHDSTASHRRLRASLMVKEEELTRELEAARMDAKSAEQMVQTLKEGFSVQKKSYDSKISTLKRELQVVLADKQAKEKEFMRAAECAEKRDKEKDRFWKKSFALLRAMRSAREKNLKKVLNQCQEDSKKAIESQISCTSEFERKAVEAKADAERKDNEIEKLSLILQSKQETVKKLEESVGDLQKSNENLQKSLENLEKSLKKKCTREADLMSELKERETAVSAAKTVRKNLEKSLRNLQQSLRESEESRKDLESQIQAVSSEKANLEESLRDLQRLREEMEEKLMDLQTQIDSERKSRENVEKIRENLQKSLGKTREGHQEELQEATTRISSLEADKKDLEKSNNLLGISKKSLEESLENLQKSLKSALDRLEASEREIESLKSNLHTALAERSSAQAEAEHTIAESEAAAASAAEEVRAIKARLERIKESKEMAEDLARSAQKEAQAARKAAEGDSSHLDALTLERAEKAEEALVAEKKVKEKLESQISQVEAWQVRMRHVVLTIQKEIERTKEGRARERKLIESKEKASQQDHHRRQEWEKEERERARKHFEHRFKVEMSKMEERLKMSDGGIKDGEREAMMDLFQQEKTRLEAQANKAAANAEKLKAKLEKQRENTRRWRAKARELQGRSPDGIPVKRGETKAVEEKSKKKTFTTAVTQTQARERLCKLLRKHNPSRLPNVDKLLTKFKNREEELIRLVKAKYEDKDQTSNSEGGLFGSVLGGSLGVVSNLGSGFGGLFNVNSQTSAPIPSESSKISANSKPTPDAKTRRSRKKLKTTRSEGDGPEKSKLKPTNAGNA